MFYQTPWGAGQPAWPLLLAAPMRLLGGHPQAAYLVAVSLSSLLWTLTVIPLFLMARQWLPWREAVAAALLVAVMPGATLQGWAVLTEPLYTLVLLAGAAWFLRAVRTERVGDFAGCALLAGATFWVRPTGVACVLACAAGAGLWGVRKRQWLQPVAATLVLGAVLSLGLLWKSMSRPGEAALSNYGDDVETSAIRWTWVALSGLGGWRDWAVTLARDFDYGLVATFGIFLPLALAGAARGLLRFRRLGPGTQALVAGALVLAAATVAIASLKRIAAIGPERMYGRYVESLVPLVVLVGAVGWRRFSRSRTQRRNLLLLVILLVVVLGLTLPVGEVSFTNNAGFWYWYVLYQCTRPAAALVALVVLWLLYSRARRHRLASLMAVIVLAACSTALVGRHIYRYNEDSRPFRDAMAGACRAVRDLAPADRRATLWLGPMGAAPGDPQPGWAFPASCWLGYGLPEMDARCLKRDDVVAAGDFLFTSAPVIAGTPVWQCGPMRIYRIDRRNLVLPGDPPSAGAAYPPPGTP